MNILMISVFEGEIPPKRYGGVERMVAWQIEELQKRGHEVTLIGNINSTMDCRIIPYTPSQKRQVISNFITHNADKYDMIHEHGQSYTCGHIQNYLWSNSDSGPNLFNKFKNKVQHTQVQALAEGLPDYAFAHIGSPDDTIYDDEKEDYMVWTSCISHRHGADVAVQTAIRNKTKLIFVNDLNLNQGGYKEFVEPYLGPYIEFFNLSDFSSDIAEIKKQQIVSKAKALIAPARDTTFGIVIIEAMSAGTPAIVAGSDDPMGQPPAEIVEHGLTGFVCRTDSEYDQAIRDISNISPSACFSRFKKCFTIEKMMDKYELLYAKIRGGVQW